MSEEKLYAIKNDEGKYWEFEDQDGFRKLGSALRPTTAEEIDAKDVIQYYGGHIVTFIEEPKKVVLTKEQAKIVDGTHDEEYPATCISDYTDEHDDKESLLMNAFVNGYTVAKEKKYNIKVPHANYNWYIKTPNGKLDTIFVERLAKGFDGYPDGIELTNDDIENFGLQDCEKEDVTDDKQ